MKMLKLLGSMAQCLLAPALVLALAVPAMASSHREAPAIARDPTADVTDVYAFRSPDRPDTVTLIANWIPLQPPAGGPNFYNFDDSVLYTIHVDTVGDGRPDISYEFRFRTEVQNPGSFLYNTGPITALDDPDFNIRQFYSLTRVTRSPAPGDGEADDDEGDDSGSVAEVLVENAPVPPVNIGPRSTPDYDSLAAAAVMPLDDGGQVFVGQRDDPFFVDLGSVFDLAGLRPLNGFHLIPLAPADGVDGVAGYNVNTTAIQVPISSLGASNDVIGVYAAAYRSRRRTLLRNGATRNSGPMVQVSRLAMPLVNEILIPLAAKDRWNASSPQDDEQFDDFILNPEPALLENLLFPPITDTETTSRVDLLAVFHTGVPGLNTLPQQVHADLIRLNMAIPPTTTPSPLGVLAGDLAGFPNGRRLEDDVVDIELQAVACAYGAVGGLVFGLTGNCDPSIFNSFPNNAIVDGVDANDKPFLPTFPYMASPFQGYEAVPPTP